MSTRINNDNHYLNNLYTHLVGRLSSLMNQNKGRGKRGLVDGLGTVVKFITGNPDANDLKQIDNSIKELQENQQILLDNLNQTISKVEIRLRSIKKDINMLYDLTTSNKVNLDILTSLVLIEDIINILELGITLAKPGIAYKDIFEEAHDVEIDHIMVYTVKTSYILLQR